MADQIGRRKVFMATALNVAIATGIMALTPDQDAFVPGWLFLAFFRFFVGFGNAGLIAVDIPLVQEFVPAYKRGWVSGLTTVLLPAGNLLGALSGAFLAPVIGWRGLFLVGLAPAALVLMIRYWVPESPHWLLRMGRMEEARKSLAWALQVDPRQIALPTSIPDEVKAVPWRAVVPLSAQRGGVLPDRDQPDRRRRAAAVDHRAVRAGAAHHAGRGLVPDDLRAASSGSPVGCCARTCPMRSAGARSGMLIGYGGAITMALAGYLNSVWLGGVSLFFVLVMFQRFFGDGSYAIIGPYIAEVWPAQAARQRHGAGLWRRQSRQDHRASRPGADHRFVRTTSARRRRSTRSPPAFLFLAFWYALAATAFWLVAFETKGRSIEEIDASLAEAVTSEGAGLNYPSQTDTRSRTTGLAAGEPPPTCVPT